MMRKRKHNNNNSNNNSNNNYNNNHYCNCEHNYHYYISKENELVLSNFDQEFFKAAIDSGLIQGTYDETSVALRDSTENLIKLIKGRGKKEYLFEPFIYNRMKK